MSQSRAWMLPVVLWTSAGECSVCRYVPQMGNRRTARSRANWLRYCRERHEQMHVVNGDARMSFGGEVQR